MSLKSAIWELYDSKAYELSIVHAGANLLDDLTTFKGETGPVALPVNIQNAKVEEAGDVAIHSMNAMELSNKALLFLGGDPHANANYKHIYRNNNGNVDAALVNELKKIDFLKDKSLPDQVAKELQANVKAVADYVDTNKGKNLSNILKAKIVELAPDANAATVLLTDVSSKAGVTEKALSEFVTGKQTCSNQHVLGSIANALGIDQIVLIEAGKLDGINTDKVSNKTITTKNIDQQGSNIMLNPDQQQDKTNGNQVAEPVATEKAMPNVTATTPAAVSAADFETLKSKLLLQQKENETLKANQEALREELTWKEYIAEASALKDLPCTLTEAATLLKAVDKIGNEIHTAKSLASAEAVDAPALLRRILKGAAEQYTQKTKEKGTSASGQAVKGVQEKISAEIARVHGENVNELTATEKSVAHSRAVAKLIKESPEFAKQYQEQFKN